MRSGATAGARLLSVGIPPNVPSPGARAGVLPEAYALAGEPRQQLGARARIERVHDAAQDVHEAKHAEHDAGEELELGEDVGGVQGGRLAERRHRQVRLDSARKIRQVEAGALHRVRLLAVRAQEALRTRRTGRTPQRTPQRTLTDIGGGPQAGAA